MNDQNDQWIHWHRETDDQRLCWLTLDKAESTANTLSQEVMREFDSVLDVLAAERPRGLVILSGKASGFILGADVSEFVRLESATDGTRFSAEGQRIFAKLEALRFPTVAAIDGSALGGGLELALACKYRVAVRGYARNLGVPEVQLGIHPGFGGTVRLVRLLGAPRALGLILGGGSMSPVEALAAGLVDRLVDAGQLREAATALIASRPAPHRPSWYLRALNFSPFRGPLCNKIREALKSRVRPEHYPAPYAVLELWQRHGAHGSAAFRAESESIGQLATSAASRNLVRIFLLRTRMKKLAPKRDPLQRIHVVGAGVMGGDIAAWCALRGLSVTLQDRAMEYVEPALQRARKLFDKRLKGPGEADAAKARLSVDLSGLQAGDADLTIEVIVEELEAKKALFAELEPRLPQSALLATNTSSLRLEAMAAALNRPERLVGLHFFNPVASLPLVEVVRGDATDDATFERALAFVVQIGKVPLPCKSAPGFAVNRVLAPYLLEALVAHEEGYAFETIDAAATDFGMPVGPVELADQVGLDVALHVAHTVAEVIGRTPPALLETKVAAKELGVKTGSGFYHYRDGRAEKAEESPKPDALLADRLILSLVNEAVACFTEGVVDDADLLDAGLVFGTGFAPFTGGPIAYARQRGIDAVVARLKELEGLLGPRFAPSAGWAQLASASAQS